MTTTKSDHVVSSELILELQARASLTEPQLSDRKQYPARHSVVEGISPWRLAVTPEVRSNVAALRWTVVRFNGTRPVPDSPVVATDTDTTIEVVVVGHDGTLTSMGLSECVIRTELDSRSLADRQLSGQGWLIPVGYTVVIDGQ